MNRSWKTLKSKHYDVSVLVKCLDDDNYIAATIRNKADLESEEIAKKIEKAYYDVNSYRIDFCKVRKCRGGKRLLQDRNPLFSKLCLN